MNSSEIPVYRDSWKLLIIFENYIPNLPKDIKHSYGNKLRDHLLNLLNNIIFANLSVNQELRYEYIVNAQSEHELIVLIKRLLVDLRLISIKQSSLLDDPIISVGRQLQGWRSSIERSFN